MTNWFVRNRDTIVPLLVVVAACLLLANLVKHGVLSASRLAQNKDSLSALQSAVQIVFIVLGSVFSYYRFFRGRTFVSRADLALDVDVFEATGAANLHSVTLALKNLGTTSIWDPKPVVRIHLHGPDGESIESWDNWREAATPGGDQAPYAVVDSGETASFTTSHKVDKKFWAVEYRAFVSDSKGFVWKRSVMVSNKFKPT